MNALIYINGEDVTPQALLSATSIDYDSTRHITTASITIGGSSVSGGSEWDASNWDEAEWTLEIPELSLVRIVDGRDGTKLFEGHVYSVALTHSDAESPEVFYQCGLNDYSAFLDRAVAWDDTFSIAFPTSDAHIVDVLVRRYCPRIDPAFLEIVVPTIMSFEFRGKTIRQVLDDMAALSGAEWRVDFDAKLHYGAPTDHPLAPFGLSTSPDYVATQPVRIDDWTRDFSNPVNRAFIRGGYINGTGVRAYAEYIDPISVDKYGEYVHAELDDEITDPYDAELKARTTVLKYAYPTEQGSFTIYTDGLKVGMRVPMDDPTLGIEGEFLIRSLSLQWRDQWLVEYKANVGAAKPDLESFLRLLDQRTRWKTANPTTGIPLPGSVTDDSIADGGLHEGSIASVSGSSVIAGSITADKIGSVSGSSIVVGSIDATRIGSVNGGVIIAGSIASEKIGSVNAGTITIGKIAAGQIGSIDAATITVGVIVSDQLADKIIDNLAKYSDALRPIRTVKVGDPWPPTMPNDNFPPNSFFFYEPNAHFYKITADGMTWTDQGTDSAAVTGAMSFYYIGKIEARSITGLILAAQIDKITAGQIAGTIEANQIGQVNASTIQGGIVASQITSVNATAITGPITSDQITSIAAGKISGPISATNITSVNATAINSPLTAAQIGSVNGAVINVGTVGDAQIGSVSGGKLTAGSVDTSKLNATEIGVGGGGNKPGRFAVYNASSQVIGEIGLLTGSVYGGWFKQFGAGGSGYSTAKVFTDASGNLFVKDANLSIEYSGAASTISTSPTAYDSTYTSLAITIATGSTDSCKYVSRGMVASYSGSTVVSVVRSPTSTNSGEVTVYGGGAIKILLDGPTGICRAERFQTAGTPGVVSEDVVISGVTLKFRGGIYIGH